MQTAARAACCVLRAFLWRRQVPAAPGTFHRLPSRPSHGASSSAAFQKEIKYTYAANMAPTLHFMVSRVSLEILE